MSFISIEIIDSESGLEWCIPLKSRITILRGDSGRGKTEMVNIIRNNVFGVSIKSKLPLIVVDSSNWEILMLNTKESILIFDNMIEIESYRFYEIMEKTEHNDNYYLIIGREYIEDKYNSLNIIKE